MRLISFTCLSLLFLSSTLASEVPPVTSAHFSLSSPLAPVPTSAPAISKPPRNTPSAFSTRVSNSDFQGLLVVDQPIFRPWFRLSDRLSLVEHTQAAKRVAYHYLMELYREIGDFPGSYEVFNVVNIGLRAFARSFTPDGDPLLPEEAFGYAGEDFVATMWERHTRSERAKKHGKRTGVRPLLLSQGPSMNSVMSISRTEIKIPTLEELKVMSRYIVSNLDAPALISLSLRAAVLMLAPTVYIDTHWWIWKIDDIMHVVFRSHNAPFHRVEDVVRSLDPVFPFLGLSSLLGLTPLALSLPPPRARFTRPYPMCGMDKSPILLTIFLERETPSPSTASGTKHHSEPFTPTIKNHVLLSPSEEVRNLRDIGIILGGLLGGFGVVVISSIVSRFHRPPPPKLQKLTTRVTAKFLSIGLSRLPLARQKEFLRSLVHYSTTSHTTALMKVHARVPRFADIDEEHLEARITELFFALPLDRQRLELSRHMARPQTSGSAVYPTDRPPPKPKRGSTSVHMLELDRAEVFDADTGGNMPNIDDPGPTRPTT